MTFKKIGLIWVASTIAFSSAYWITGLVRVQHVIALRAGLEERRLALLTGTNEPSKFDFGYAVTNVSAKTNAYSSVVFVPYAGNDTNLITAEPLTFVFNQDNWSNEQDMAISIYGNGVGDWLSPQLRLRPYVDGVSNATLRILIGMSRLGGSYYERDDGYLWIKYRDVTFHNGGGSGVDSFKLLKFPTNHITVVWQTNIVYVCTNALSSGRVDGRVSWPFLYDEIMCGSRDLFLSDETYFTEGVSPTWLIAWIPSDFEVSDGMSIAGCDAACSEIETEGIYHRWEYAQPSLCGEGVPSLASRFPDSEAFYGTGQSFTNAPIAAYLYGLAATGHTYAASALRLWPASSNYYAYSSEFWVTNVLSATRKLIVTQNLSEAYSVQKTMSRSIYICQPSLLSFTNAIRRTSTNEVYWVYSYTNPVPPAFSLPTFVSGLWSDARVQTNAALTSFSDGQLTDIYLDVGAYNTILADERCWGDRQGSLTWSSSRLEGCSLPYPCDYAMSSGYVSRVRGYAIAACSVWDDVYFGEGMDGWTNYPYGGGTVVLSFDCNGSLITNANVLAYGTGLLPSPYPMPGSTIVDSGRIDYFGSGFDIKLPREYILSPLFDVNSPTVRPMFDIGVLAPSGVSSIYQMLHRQRNAQDTSAQNETEEWYAYLACGFKVVFFVVVVDWIFQFP